MTDVVEVQGELQHGKDAADERMRLHVALAQVLPNESDKGDVPIVLPRLRAVAAQAASRGADIIVFPEYFLSGSSHEAWHEARNTDPLNTTEEHPEWLDEIQAMARELSIAIVTGSAVILHDGPDETLFNIVFFIDYRGEVRGSYTKRHLWHAERAILSNATEASHPSDDQPPVFVFETKRGLRLRTSMVMCVRTHADTVGSHVPGGVPPPALAAGPVHLGPRPAGLVGRPGRRVCADVLVR